MLDIDRDRQRISLGLKQTQEDPWQRVVSMYNVGDELEGKVTKVVTFGAFVEILDGVEGLVHISELAPYHVENPREIVEPGDEIKVKILEIDSERRRLSLSAKRVEDQILARREGAPPPDDGGRGRPRRRARARAERGRLRRRRGRGPRRGSTPPVAEAPAVRGPGRRGRRGGGRSRRRRRGSPPRPSEAPPPRRPRRRRTPPAEDAPAEDAPAEDAEADADRSSDGRRRRRGRRRLPAAEEAEAAAAEAEAPAEDERPDADELDVAPADDAAGAAAEQGTDESK